MGERLVSSPDVHMVAMTGSTATGKRIMEKCASNLKRIVLELGGKDPMVRREKCCVVCFCLLSQECCHFSAYCFKYLFNFRGEGKNMFTFCLYNEGSNTS